MARFIVKVRDRYLEWSTAVDAPVTGGMTVDELREYWVAEHGAESTERLGDWVRLADRTGTSDEVGYDWRVSNRAGPRETSLTEDEIYEVYCLGKPLDPATIRRKDAEKDERECRPSPAAPPLGDRPSTEQVKTAYEAIALDSSLAEVEVLLGEGTVMPRGKRGFAFVKWVFDDLVATCHFDRESGKLVGRQLSPNYERRR